MFLVCISAVRNKHKCVHSSPACRKRLELYQIDARSVTRLWLNYVSLYLFRLIKSRIFGNDFQPCLYAIIYLLFVQFSPISVQTQDYILCFRRDWLQETLVRSSFVWAQEGNWSSSSHFLFVSRPLTGWNSITQHNYLVAQTCDIYALMHAPQWGSVSHNRIINIHAWKVWCCKLLQYFTSLLMFEQSHHVWQRECRTPATFAVFHLGVREQFVIRLVQPSD